MEVCGSGWKYLEMEVGSDVIELEVGESIEMEMGGSVWKWVEMGVELRK